MQTFSNTRQGVRNLDVIKSKKPAGRRLEMPPEEDKCQHRNLIPIEMGLIEECKDCGAQFDTR